MTRPTIPILTGQASRRAAGVRLELITRARAALAASKVATDEGEAAALRGKARGLREAVDLVRALETGRPLRRRRRNYQLPPDRPAHPRRYG